MRINAIVPWFGSKRYLAPRIVEQLGPHRAYWEPFCGSLAVLLAKPVASQETVCDLHAEPLIYRVPGTSVHAARPSSPAARAGNGATTSS